MHIKGLFDFLAHGVRPRFRAENTHIKRCVPRVHARLGKGVKDGQGIGRGDRDPLRFKILDQANLPRCHPAGDRNSRQAEHICAQMNAKTASKQAVAVSVVQHIARLQTCRAQGPRDHLPPHVQIALGVTHDSRLSRRARGRMHPCHLIAWHRKHAKRIGVPQVLFHRKWKLGQIGQRGQVVGVHACRIKFGAIKRYILIGMGQRPFQTLGL